MEEPLPVKRRRTESPKDVSADGNVAKQWPESREINTVSVKPDKFQKLRRIATNCTGKIQNPKSDDIVISSVGSSPASSPRPENMTALSTPVDPSELHARLTVLVLEEDKENCRLKSGDENLQTGGVIGKEVKGAESDVKGDTMDKNTNTSVSAEEFYAVVRKMVSEKMRKLEETYNEKIIPDLEGKIANLENENRCLQEHAKKLQEMLTKVVTEYQKQQQKPVQVHAGVQVGTSEPPSLTPVASSVRQTMAPGNSAQVVHVIDSVPGLYKPPSSTHTLVTQVSSPASAYTLRGVTMANGIRQATVNTNTGHVFTSSAGQPRMYSEAPYKPGSHPNAVVAPRSHATYSRPPGPIMATVYPQPQNHPTSLGVPRASPPTQSPPSRFPYNPQTANGVMIRPPGQQNVQYVVNQERKDNSTAQPLGVRQKSPSVQGPPPAYSATNSRPQHHQQQQVYRPGPATNPAAQVNGVHHYQVRQAAPSGGMVGAPAGPPPLVRAPSPLVRAPSNMRPQVNNAPRYQTPMRHRAPYQQNTPGSNPRAQASAASSRNPVAPPPPSQTSPPQTNGIVRDQLPPIPIVSISGASNGIVLSWNMTIPDGCAPIDSYQLFAYQNNSNTANSPSLWKKLGIVKALPLPMACTLTQFVSGSMYYFAVRAIDVHGRAGGYSSPCAITLPNESEKGRA